MCIEIGSISLEYPGNTNHAIWSIVIATIAMIFIQFEFNDAFMFSPTTSDLFV
jgi:hypothetical protein